MTSMNSIRLATAVSSLPFTSAIQRIQGYREEQVTFWVHVASSSGSQLQIRGAPDDAALALGGGTGAILHTIITSGTAGAGQTKINAGGHAVVTVQAQPIMLISITGGLGTDTWNVWLLE